MESSLVLVAAPLAGFALNVCCQWLILRLGHGKQLAVSIIAGFLAGLTLTLVLTLSTHRGIAAGLVIVNLITAASLGFCYWAFLNLNITSMRIRILREMLQMGGTSMTDEYLRSLYSESEMLDRRLRRLLETKHIRYREGRYTVQSSPLLVLANVLRCLRKILIAPRLRPPLG
jgi:hypothetical protein